MKRDTILTLRLPTEKGPQEYAVREPRKFERPKKPFTRKAFAAAHVDAYLMGETQLPAPVRPTDVAIGLQPA